MKTKGKPVKTKQPGQPPQLRRKYIMYGLSGGVLLGGGYLLYSYLQDRAAMSRSGRLLEPIAPTLPDNTQVIVKNNSGSFPLKKGSRGEVVKMLQNALLAIGDKAASHIQTSSIKPDGTPDGVFGSGTEKALVAADYPIAVSESTFSQLIATGRAKAGSKALTPQDSQTLASELIKAADDRNLFATLSGLQKIKDVGHYTSVSSHFKKTRILGIRVTSLVNALLSVVFRNNEPAKVKIRAEFRRMGLKQNSKGVWYVPGLGELTTPQEWKEYQDDKSLLNIAIAQKPTLLKTGDGNYITPPLNPNTVIGYVTANHKGITQIITRDRETVYAPSQNLKLI